MSSDEVKKIDEELEAREKTRKALKTLEETQAFILQTKRIKKQKAGKDTVIINDGLERPW